MTREELKALAVRCSRFLPSEGLDGVLRLAESGSGVEAVGVVGR